MKKFSWALTILGILLILGSVLYPIGVITKSLFIYILLSGAFIMFVGSMIRTYATLKK